MSKNLGISSKSKRAPEQIRLKPIKEEKRMKVFYMQDSDGGSATYVVADDIRSALDLFKESYGYDPESIRDMTADHEIVLI